MDTFNRNLKIGHRILNLELKGQYALVSVDDMNFNRLDELVKHLPELSKPNFVETFAVVANFLFNGNSFEVIHSSERLDYNYSIEKPAVKDHEAVFYVQELSTGLLYKVTCKFPYVGPTDSFAYIPLVIPKTV